MEKIIFTANGSPLTLQSSIPQNMRNVFIPGSCYFSMEHNFGKLLYQVLKLPDCTIGYWNFSCSQDISISIRGGRFPHLYLISLTQPANCFFYGLGNLNMTNNGTYILYLPYLHAILPCKKDTYYRYVAINFATEVCTNFASNFPLLQQFIYDTIKVPDSPHCYLTSAMTIHRSHLALIQELLQTNFATKKNTAVGALLAKTILQLALVESNASIRGPSVPFNLLDYLRKEIEANPQRAPNVQKYAALFRFSKSKLEKDFQSLYHQLPYQYWQYYRMLFYATQQLVGNRIPIQSISKKMGFGKESGNFSRKFKSFCGYNPGSYRKMFS